MGSRVKDVAIALIVAVTAGWWGAHYVRASHNAGRSAWYYQDLFEPAVMTACGKGFHAAVNPPPAMTRFLQRLDERFSCASLPSDLQMRPGLIPQGSWLYLMLVAGWAWRLLGDISWIGLAPLFGLLFGLASASAYSIFRFGMGRVAATLCASAFSLSALQVGNLPNLRDYAKAPFMLALIALALALALRPFSARRVLVLSACYGAIVGLGYGLKPDTLVQMPVLVVTLSLFLPGSLRANLRVKMAALMLATATCVLAMWPVVHETPASGNNLWHVALVGLMPEYGTALGVENSTYHFGVTGSDEFVMSAVGKYARRGRADAPTLQLATAEYEAATRSYFLEFVRRFPADMITRAAASMAQIPELPFGWPAAPLPGQLDRFYAIRQRVLEPMYGFGIVLTLGAIVGVALVRPRQGLFLLFLFAYLASFPVIEFHNRNYFYLEAIGWLAIGFVGTEVVHRVRRGTWLDAAMTRRTLSVRALTGAAAVAVALLALAGLRVYQANTMRRTIAAYLHAPRERLIESSQDGAPGGVTPLVDARTNPFWSRLLRVELSEAACGPGTLTFRYDRESPNRFFASSVALPRPIADRGAHTVLFQPVYSGFSAIELNDVPSQCLVSVDTVTGLDAEPIWLCLMLDSNWQHRPLYQAINSRAVVH